MKREYKDYLFDIVDAIEKIENFTEGLSYKDFESDDKTIFAVIRAFEIIGEAVKKIPKKIRDENKNIPWKLISGMRDKLVHDYFGVDIKVVWKTIKEYLSIIPFGNILIPLLHIRF